ncbi:Nicotinate phosphoribosyltransferase pncB2 [Anaerohalosphaera lusitana]|uniref:Nicotinate phosphoribosyltransferase n=1 Tax=Anaerohalosphaera lusitana TaxID=1936003 RepID=A0A1U9NQT9_9BACT|nr:nicotinate phosphoribosyltransferase [Anaerohalosphaera lusitana]AQT70293.1 Nicotinate phosphoribosyltransferase pncB2 [Anaerohalosphaera lusitana]
MYLLNQSPALLTDLYELTMAQVYWQKDFNDHACFEVFIRKLPDDWGFFVMSGLAELKSYLQNVRFTEDDIHYLRTLDMFDPAFLDYLQNIDFESVEIRALPEGTPFFPNEPILEVKGPILTAQLLETYILNILGFSIIQATAASRLQIAAQGRAVVDFGMRRAQGPVSSIRAARGAVTAGMPATSNVLAAKLLNAKPSGTMAHSFIQAYTKEEDAFESFARTYKSKAVLLVDTYDTVNGIKLAAKVARKLDTEDNIQIRGIRIDSGDLVKMSNFARRHFDENNVEWIKIFVSGNLDEYKIDDIVQQRGQVDGFGVGTSLAVSRYAPSVDIAYKLVRYGDRDVYKKSENKATHPGRKTLHRTFRDNRYEHDDVIKYQPSSDDLLRPFSEPEPLHKIAERLNTMLYHLAPAYKKIRNPETFPVNFHIKLPE